MLAHCRCSSTRTAGKIILETMSVSMSENPNKLQGIEAVKTQESIIGSAFVRKNTFILKLDFRLKYDLIFQNLA